MRDIALAAEEAGPDAATVRFPMDRLETASE
jgi:hypothetical protein